MYRFISKDREYNVWSIIAEKDGKILTDEVHPARNKLFNFDRIFFLHAKTQ